MNLAQTQALFWKAITWPTGIDDFLAHADDATRAQFEATFAQSPGFGRSQRVQVYAEAYFWRLFEVVADQYPIVAWLAGKRWFHNLVTDFVLACPSQTPDLRRFAAGFAAFVRRHDAERQRPGLAAVAEIDWAIVAAVDMPDEPRIDSTVLASLPASAWPEARFTLTRTANTFDSVLPYSALWSAHARDEAPPIAVEPATTPHVVLVWRQADHDVYQRTLPAAEARALRALHSGGTFAEICDAGAGLDASEATAQTVVTWLRRWLDDGLLTAVRADD